MVRAAKPVLIIDDEDGRATQRLLGDSVGSVVRHPNDVSASDLRRAKLILVDFKLSNWEERDAQTTPSLRPANGIALIAVLRSNLSALDAGSSAFALNSGMLSDLNAGRPAAGREHAIAQSIDIEWVFDKGKKGPDFPGSVKSLVEAVQRLPTNWARALETKDELNKALRLGNRYAWFRSASDAVDRAFPPHDILLGNGSGIAVLRWLLHTVLPYPTFLIDYRYMAARLRVTPASLLKILTSKSDNRLKRATRSFEYRGVLSDFAGKRWWRAGLEGWLWKHTRGNPFDHAAIRTALNRLLPNNRLTFVDFRNPVVSLDRELRPSDELLELEGSVEIKPDHWPSFADSAWISPGLAQEPAFLALVPQSRREQFGDD